MHVKPVLVLALSAIERRAKPGAVGPRMGWYGMALVVGWAWPEYGNSRGVF